MTALAGEGQEIFMLTIRALHPCKAVVQVATFQVAVNDLPKIGPPEPVPPFEFLTQDTRIRTEEISASANSPWATTRIPIIFFSLYLSMKGRP